MFKCMTCCIKLGNKCTSTLQESHKLLTLLSVCHFTVSAPPNDISFLKKIKLPLKTNAACMMAIVILNEYYRLCLVCAEKIW